MYVSTNTKLDDDELDKKQQLEDSVREGIEAGKRGFQQAAIALLRIDELALWRDEANSFNQYREKFKSLLEDMDITDRHLNRLIATQKCVQMLRPIGLNITQQKESHFRPLTQLKEPKQVQQAYKRAIEIAETQGEEPKAKHFEAAVAEIKPPKVKLSKPPRIPIGAVVEVRKHFPDEEVAGTEGIVTQHPSADRCIVRFGDESRLIPDNMLAAVEGTKEFTSTKQEDTYMARSLGLRCRGDKASPTRLQVLPDIARNEGVMSESEQLEIEVAIAAFLRVLPRLSHQQKGMVYEQLMKVAV
ncbi:MAG: hypothetical protein KME54_26450 [Tolypothrix brevis GSE-NOS-MK-07-07A]|jgi:hypothetical protein|nr:hypothetical protein [Tolypothrix brevis GSE-NOS-MK-07-07A]